jgi:hypothetical protein
MSENVQVVERDAQSRRRSRYNRPRRYIAWSALLIGVILGAAGGVFFAWNIAPTREFDTEPWQLTRSDQANYLVAILVSHRNHSDLARTIQRLDQLRPSVDPIQYVADVACDLAKTGYVSSNSGLNAVRAMMAFYQGQGRQGCADSLIPLVNEAVVTEEILIAPTPTLQPPPSKTPTLQVTSQQTPTERALIVPTERPQSTFRLAYTEPFCDAEFGGVIEVLVRNNNGNAMPGQPVRVRWDEGESTFFTGLKPERGLDYADFEMEANKGYIVDMPGLSDPSTTPLVADLCTDAQGVETIQSYRVVFVTAIE